VTPDRLASLAAYAGQQLRSEGPRGPYPFSPYVPIDAHNVVYVVCGWSGQALYVGSTTVGVRARFAQHLSDQVKTLDWTTVYVIPLNDEATVREVRRIEGRIGLAIGPARTKALPRLAND
jgi:hypothetical protein